MSHGNMVNGQRHELALRVTEALLANPPRRRVPASILLNQIAQDALAAVLRDDTQAVAELPTTVRFRAVAVPSQTFTGRWRLIVIAKACGAWGSHTSGLINGESFARGLAEMINGPAPVITKPANSDTPLSTVSPSTVQSAVWVGVLDALCGAWKAKRGVTARSKQPSAAAARSTPVTQSVIAPPGDINCALSPVAFETSAAG